MNERWDPNNDTYRETTDKIARTVDTTNPRVVQDLIGCAVQQGLKHGVQPTELRQTFDAALQHNTREQTAGSSQSR